MTSFVYICDNNTTIYSDREWMARFVKHTFNFGFLIRNNINDYLRYYVQHNSTGLKEQLLQSMKRLQ